jgi:hypothetical protein
MSTPIQVVKFAELVKSLRPEDSEASAKVEAFCARALGEGVELGKAVAGQYVRWRRVGSRAWRTFKEAP